MRLFFDTMMMTYIAVFEGYLVEGSQAEKEDAIRFWTVYQTTPPDPRLLHEVEALRMVYLMDEQAHFDWLCSDVAIDEIMKIPDLGKRQVHYPFLDRLIEHRHDVYAEEERHFTFAEREALRASIFPKMSKTFENDEMQYCEALLVGADYFLTNDSDFIKRVARAKADIPVYRVSELPFVLKVLGRT